MTTQYSVIRWSIIKTEHGTCSCPVSMQCLTINSSSLWNKVSHYTREQVSLHVTTHCNSVQYSDWLH